MRNIKLPIVINGQPIYSSNNLPEYRIKYANDIEVSICAPEQTLLDDLKSQDKFLLAQLKTQEILGFLQKVGNFWSLGNIQHPLYQQALDHLSQLTGYDRKMAQRELNIIRVVCSHSSALADIIDAEIGNRLYLDEWLPRGDALAHGQPWGNLIHIMVGNVPVASIMSLVRGIITKNRTIAKLPKRDPITGLYFALSMREIDPDHPVTRSMNVMYWPGGQDVEKKIIDEADVMCVWGGMNAVRGIKKLARPYVKVLEFGPKTSFAIVGKESVNSRKVAIDLAHDIAIYNQEACFSPQIAFVEGNVLAFVDHLKQALSLYESILPRGLVPIDVDAHVSRSRLEALFAGQQVIASEGTTDWTIAVIDDPEQINEHPLGRTIYVIPVNTIGEPLKYISPDTQTIILSPWSRNTEIRDEATLRGAAKITEIGLAEWQRIGMPHDNIYPLHELVRWVAVERGCDHWGKYIAEGPIDTTKWLMMHNKQLEHVV